MDAEKEAFVTNPPSSSKEKPSNIFKRARRKVKKVTGVGKGKSPTLEKRRSTNPVSLAASEALHATRKSLKLSVSAY